MTASDESSVIQLAGLMVASEGGGSVPCYDTPFSWRTSHMWCKKWCGLNALSAKILIVVQKSLHFSVCTCEISVPCYDTPSSWRTSHTWQRKWCGLNALSAKNTLYFSVFTCEILITNMTVCMCVCLCMCMSVYLYVCLHVCTCLYVCMCATHLSSGAILPWPRKCHQLKMPSLHTRGWQQMYMQKHQYHM